MTDTPQLQEEQDKIFQEELERKCEEMGYASYLVFNKNGKRIVAWLKKPNYLSSIQAFDFINAGKAFQAGNAIFASCFDFALSDKECQEDIYKASIVAHLSTLLEIASPEFKKK